MTIVLTIIFIIAICFYQSITYKRMYTYVTNKLSESLSPYSPYAAIILPCKGLDPDFENGLRKLFTQDYGVSAQERVNMGSPNFEIVFSVANITDLAYPVIKKIISEYPSVKAKLIVAGIDNKRAQKITNQLEALKEISPEVEILVFVDSDVIAGPDFLTRLITPLQDITIGITTGYRFYLPATFNLPGALRSLWNRVSAWELSGEKFAFAWGGAMAIRRQVFNEARIVEVWDRSADDDLAMTVAVKSLGLLVNFVPQCLVVSHGDTSWSEVIEWTNRQLILTKVYYPALWLMGVIRAFVMVVWLIVVLFLCFQIVALHVYKFLTVLLAASMLLVVEFYFLFQAHGLWGKLLNREVQDGAITWKFEDAYKNLLWQSLLVLPLAHVILPLLTLYSLLTNRIRWRGINYELRSPTETIVV